MIDTHTHLYPSQLTGAGDSSGAAVDRAVAAGVDMMVMPNVDLTTIGPLKEIARLRPDCVRMAMGLHPTEVDHNWSVAVDRIEAELTGPDGDKYVAIGEIGIDLYWDSTYRDSQIMAFERQASLGASLGLPLIIHCREGLDETLGVIERLPSPPPAIVMHCFGGSTSDVAEIRRRATNVPEIFFGIGGIVTFKKSTLPDVLPEIGLDHIVLETDSPYLAPVPHRGKRNESAYLPAIAAKIASTLYPDTNPQEAIAKVEAATAANTLRLFPRLKPE